MRFHGDSVLGIEPGHYARRLLASKSQIVRFSHTRRFHLARQLVEPLAGGHLLDYGCGDGTFLALVRDLFPAAVGADAEPCQLDDCRRRFAGVAGISFVRTAELRSSEFKALFDAIICTEVLEHCLEKDVTIVLNDLIYLAAPGARIVISVQIEIGPSLMVKQAIRSFASRRHIGGYEYREKYTSPEILKMLFADRSTAISRPVYGDDKFSYHGHKGFNWRTLRDEIAQLFEIREIRYTPIPAARSLLNSQVWFVCSPGRTRSLQRPEQTKVR
jgi:SAM-dependent methyltransferase